MQHAQKKRMIVRGEEKYTSYRNPWTDVKLILNKLENYISITFTNV